MRAPVTFALVTALLLAGCVGIPDPEETIDTAEEALANILALRADGTLDVEVPVHVVVLGYDAGVADALASRLEREPAHHGVIDFSRGFPPNPQSPFGGYAFRAMPIAPVAVPVVHEASANLVAGYRDALAANSIGSGVYDGNAVEDWLADNLPLHGIPVSRNLPILVLVHGDEAGSDGHTFRYSYQNGHLDNVRFFGERRPVLVLDMSAAPNPWAGTRNAYDGPRAAGGDATVAALKDLVRDAVQFRLLQGAIYPITLKECHAVTLVVAVRAASVAEKFPGVKKAEDLVDTEALKRAFENATGEGTVHVDAKFLLLPVDDPVLDAIVRGSMGTTGAFRWWMDMNWDRYWVPHDGCEPYVSFLLLGDPADDPMLAGVALYSVEEDRRVSFSYVGDFWRLMDSPGAPTDGVIRLRASNQGEFDWVNFLFSHETGHLLGQHHPHNIIFHDGAFESSFSFSAVWTSMSYAVADRTLDFGSVDYTNHMRNRAGYFVQAAYEAGLAETPEFERAWELLRVHEWRAAGDVLRDLLQDQ